MCTEKEQGGKEEETGPASEEGTGPCLQGTPRALHDDDDDDGSNR